VLLDAIAAPAEVVDGATSCTDVDEQLVRRPDLSCVVVVDRNGAHHVLTRRTFALDMAGPLGYGRALHGRRAVLELASRTETLALPAATTLAAAGDMALDRAAARRYDDVLVTGRPRLGTVSVTDLFSHLALVHEHRALHDPLTRLANRDGFAAAVERALGDGRAPTGAGVTVLFIDLDDFKAINDGLGHSAGDELISTLAARLRAAFRDSDVVGRLGGDEFAVLLVDGDEDTARGAAERVRTLLGHPVIIDDRVVHMGASVGIATQTGPERDVGALLRNADLAMYEAKRAGKGRHAAFRPALHERAVADLELLSDLSRAVARGEMRVVYQPIVHLETQAICGVEALLRWQHPRRGAIAPLDFIGLAESSGAITDIGAWVLGEACRQVSRWDGGDLAATPLHLAVNVSVRQLESPQFVAIVAAALTESGLPAERLTLEITESGLARSDGTVLEVLDALHDAGVRLAIDDFGTGYSSFARLDGLPAGLLKIDRSFLARLDRTGSEDVLRGLLGLARAMGIEALVEGVETAEQAAVMRRLGCRLAQGYFFDRPLEAGELADRLRGAAALI